MLLVIDIGNTHITMGLFSQELVAHWRVTSGTNRTEDESWLMIKMLFQSENLSIDRIEGCAISSVVPGLTPIFVEMIKNKIKIDPLVVSAELDVGLKILYHAPDSVGPDRICNSVAGLELFGGPLIIVDFGTATTFDVVSEKAEYLGGVICPGLETSSYVLHRYAARLPNVELKFPQNVIGKTTESSMQSGIMFGTVDMVNGIVRRLIKEIGKDAQVIATGGIAVQIFDMLEKSHKFEPFLTLDGLRIIYNKITK